MTRKEWGNRFICYSCGCKYYDLNRPEPLCPRCGADPREVVVGARPAPRQSRASASSDVEEGESDITDESLDIDFEGGGILDDEEEDVEEDLEGEEDEEEEEY